KSGNVLEFSGQQSVPFTGQGFAHDPKTGGLVGINRSQHMVVFADKVK
ncbi:MAG: endonuclease, partial [Planctomycetaceae bacterium]|nr:endonuclease [Planctomycetaceae bacterium]